MGSSRLLLLAVFLVGITACAESESTVGATATSANAKTPTTAAPTTTRTVEAVRALNEDFERLNERTWDAIPATGEDEPIPASYASLLEENWVEGVKLMGQMVEQAPEDIKADLSFYTEAQGKMSEMYAEYDYIQAVVWANADYETWLAEYAGIEEARTRIREWFTANCGTDLEG